MVPEVRMDDFGKRGGGGGFFFFAVINYPFTLSIINLKRKPLICKVTVEKFPWGKW